MAETRAQKRDDLKRAERIAAKLDQARQKAQEARNLLYEAHLLAVEDTYPSVVDYDAPDIKEVWTALKVAGTKPIIQLTVRWSDIVHGRREDVGK